MNRITLTYLASYCLSMLGNSIAAIALPLILLQMTGSVLSAGVLAAATALPAFFAGLLMGVVIDRINRLTSSVVADLISAASIAALPLVDLMTGLNLGWFILFGIIGSVGDAPGLTAREAILPAIVRHGTLSAERLMGIRESLGALIVVIGPAAAGGLMVLFDGSTVLWITAATSFGAAMLTLLIPHRVGELPVVEHSTALPAAPRPQSVWGQFREAWVELFHRSRFLRAVTFLSLALMTVIGALQGIVLPAHFAFINEPGLFGFTLTALAAGTLVGGGLYAGLGTRGSRRGWFSCGLIGTVVGFTLIGVLPALWWIFVGAFVLGFASGLFGSLLGVLMIERIPDHMRGRMMGTQNSLAMLAAPAGMLAAALIGEYAGLVAAGITMAALWAMAALTALVSPAFRDLEAAPATMDTTKGGRA